MVNPKEVFEIDEKPEWTLDLQEGDLLESCYSFNWDQVSETLNRLRQFRHMNPTDPREALILNLLPVIDGFESIFAIAREKNAFENDALANWLKSFEGVYKRLMKVLSQEGVQAIDSVGRNVDLDMHDVVEVQHCCDSEPGTILKETQKGYTLKDRVLRDAKVVVAKPEPKSGG